MASLEFLPRPTGARVIPARLVAHQQWGMLDRAGYLAFCGAFGSPLQPIFKNIPDIFWKLFSIFLMLFQIV